MQKKPLRGWVENRSAKWVLRQLTPETRPLRGVSALNSGDYKHRGRTNGLIFENIKQHQESQQLYFSRYLLTQWTVSLLLGPRG